jgi:hypothetical protein
MQAAVPPAGGVKVQVFPAQQAWPRAPQATQLPPEQTPPLLQAEPLQQV